MRLTSRALVAALLVLLVPMMGVARAETPSPSSWPSTSVIKPSIDGWPHALRIFGADRYQTGFSASLMLRGAGGASSYPFGNPDPATSSGWWGLGTCPRAIIVAAGDNPADALVASSLSDPTGQSSEPFLQRSAAADPLFDPVGGFQRVDTEFAPILITRSSRQGATSLDVATRLAAQDLRSGGCTSARQAIIVGGTSSIPSSVDTELVAVGYEQVFRVAGSSRYDTAKLVAESLGTAVAPGSPTPTTCFDPLTDDGNARMKFYANSVVELRDSAQQCRLLSRTVVIADGLSGIDALAAGWWTSFWQVPVLLHNGTDSLPAATLQALQTLRVENVIVLGGTARISEQVMTQIASATNGAAVVRVAGTDRYATSVEMARKFGGWYPVGRGAEFAGSMVCIAASSGGSSTSPGTGWADALSAGPWCARANGAAANPKPPVRALAPTLGRAPTVSASVTPLARPGHDAVPVLLVPAGGSSLPSPVENLLSGAFDPSDNWCTSVSAGPGCLAPGFALVFGGASSVSEAQVDALSRLASGGKTVGNADRLPGLTSTFVTSLDMSPVFDDVSPAGGANRVCASRGGYVGARWLTMAGPTGSATVDVMTRGRYVSDADSVTRSAGVGAPVCVPAPGDGFGTLVTRAVSLAGPVSDGFSSQILPANRFVMSSTVSAASPQSSSGVLSEVDTSAGGSTTWTFASSGPVSVTSRGVSSPVSSATLVITLLRGTNTATQTGPDTITGSFTLVSALGTVTGSLAGEAVLGAGVWRLRGTASFGAGTWNVSGGSGGFAADVMIAGSGTLADDSAVWRLDGVVG